MKNLKKLLALAMATAMIFSLAACGSTAEETKEEETTEETTEESTEDEAEAVEMKVALILSGSITDASWNANGYNALKDNADEMGFDFSYIENVQEADMEASIRDFCESGYNLIIAHGSQFDDAMANVAGNYPDIYFFVYNGEVSGDNLVSLRNAADENAFISGAIAALASKTGIIGWIGAVEVPTTAEVFDGYNAGAKYVKPEIEVLSAYVGSYNDTAKAKELALTMIEKNADVIQSNANQGTAGIIEALYEQGTDSGLMMIGNTRDQYEDAPEFMLTSDTISFKQAYRLIIDAVAEGRFEGGVSLCTVGNGVMGVADYHDLADALSDDDKATIEQLKADLADGKLYAELPCDYSLYGRPNE